MTVAADTFAEFVDGLAGALDDHEASGEDWAARHHFSRFHFDRIIKSVGGEPPQALRRRILLERAAYRMITTKAPLIDIAIEAGYSSHEAFTRAFTKAYDVPPREWRKKPGHIQIGEPLSVHFVPPGSIRLPSRDTVRGPDLVEKMVEHHVWLTGEMVRLAARLTPEQLDEPVLVEVDDARLLADGKEQMLDSDDARVRSLEVLPLPKELDRFVAQRAKRRAKGRKPRKVRVAEYALVDGASVEILGYKSRTIDPTIASRLERDTPFRATLKGGKNLPLLIAPRPA